MTDPTGLVERLRENASETAQTWSDAIMIEAADALEEQAAALQSQAAEIERLRGALREISGNEGVSATVPDMAEAWRVIARKRRLVAMDALGDTDDSQSPAASEQER